MLFWKSYGDFVSKVVFIFGINDERFRNTLGRARNLLTRGYGLGALGAAGLVGLSAIGFGMTKFFSGASRLSIMGGGRLLVAVENRLNPAKIIARNKYFNKTIGLFWQIGSDAKDLARRRYRR